MHISSYGYTREVWRAQERRKSCSRRSLAYVEKCTMMTACYVIIYYVAVFSVPSHPSVLQREMKTVLAIPTSVTAVC